MIHEHQIEKIKGRLLSKEEVERDVNLSNLIRNVKEEIKDKLREHFSKTDKEFTYIKQITDNYAIMVRVAKDKETGRLYYFYYFKHRIPYREYYFYKEEEEL